MERGLSPVSSEGVLNRGMDRGGGQYLGLVCEKDLGVRYKDGGREGEPPHAAQHTSFFDLQTKGITST